MIPRRRFLQLTAAGSFAITGVGRGQAAPEPMKRVGTLAEGEPLPPPPGAIEAFRQRGWILGQNLSFERRFARHPDQLPELARELVHSNVDIILTWSTRATQAAKAATNTIPIIFEVGDDPVARGLVASMARPGGNVSGLTFGLYDEKLLQVLKEAIPKAARVMYPSATPGDASQRAAKALNVEIIGFAVPGPDGLDAFIHAVRKTRPDGVVLPNMNWMSPYAARLAHDLKAARVPSIAVWSDFAKAGGLLAYGAQGLELRRMAQIDAALRGAKPAEMPVEMPTHFHLIVNLDTAKAIGVTIPPLLLTRAEVIRTTAAKSP